MTDHFLYMRGTENGVVDLNGVDGSDFGHLEFEMSRTRGVSGGGRERAGAGLNMWEMNQFPVIIPIWQDVVGYWGVSIGLWRGRPRMQKPA